MKHKLIEGFWFPFHIDENWLKNIIKEIWEEHEYDRYGLEIKGGDIILDFGANVGVFTKYSSIKKAQVYAFESDPIYFECLKLNTHCYSNVNIKQGFVSDRFEENHYNFSTIFELYNLTHVDFCKIDIEGWEYPLLINSPIEYLKKIKQISIEMHGLGVNDHKILEIIEILSKCGFKLNFEQIHKQYNIGMLYAKNMSS